MILPLVAEILTRVRRLPAVEEAFEQLRHDAPPVQLAGLVHAAKALILALAPATMGRTVILLVGSNERAEQLADPARYFYRATASKPDRRVVVLPALEVLPYGGQSPHPEICEARAAALWRIARGDADIVIAPVAAALFRLREAEFYRQLAFELERDQEVPREEFLERLASVGYESHETVEMPGQFAVRGGIVDVFSPEALRPLRLELLGDTLDSLREFDPNTQRSTHPLERATLVPLTEFPRRPRLFKRLPKKILVARGANENGEATELEPGFFPGWEFQTLLADPPESNLFELCPGSLILADETEALAAALAKFRARLAEASAASNLKFSAPPEDFVLSEREWTQAVERMPRLLLEQLPIERGETSSLSISTQPTRRYHGNIAAFMADIRRRLQAGDQVLCSASSTGEIERLAGLCHEYELPYRLGELEEGATASRLAEESSAGSVPALLLLRAPLEEGVFFNDCRLVIHGNADLFETLPAAVRPRKKPKAAAFFSDFSDLKPGDFVVHLDHGIGRFEGLRQVAVDGVSGEFMLLAYAEDARLYVPLARLDLVQKYASVGQAPPQLDRLGAGVWEARKARVRKSVGDMAQKLLALYAERRTVKAYAFPPDTPWQREFEDGFEFEETPDQERAIEEVKRNLESPASMDRLLCGDVGYGKTEVAMRAAFKVISEGKQVAVLAPTTVLAFQHYETFKRRFAAFPVRVEMLSRFRSALQQKKVLAELEAGKADIVIGTHRLLSRDVRFHDLGLLVVDEEQRFGVAHKERIKELRKNVDVLTMSATPIPRTLRMSLVGLRDLSLIETPPKGRLAIQTVVVPFDQGLIRRAIEEELGRDGQVFFVHNRVESIASLASLVKKLVPSARVVVSHAKMRESALEKAMMKFVRHEADVLVSTTIVENGLDIPRANTILINRADRFGLAELYQLRGRVGRSDQRAYAYLLVPPEGSLSPLAKQRLAALKEFSDLGSGFRIAALDLELRGAGNLLGREQHGHIAAVGFDLYCQMLERAVAERKGERVRPEHRTTLNLGLDIRIPSDYIESEALRLQLYKRIADISNEAEQQALRHELADRFGPPPAPVEHLLEYAEVKALAEKLRIVSVVRRGERAAIKFQEDTPVKPQLLVAVIRRGRDLRLDPSGVLWLEWKREPKGILQSLRNVLLQLQP